ncbi:MULTISPECIES: hypothetical protein [Sphingomonadales]|uniref:Uncharacterized protein n=1 Tax=Edaphosphingomonas haloaromaticamans TaxID=653954 RepID=A0A1S1HGZ9_9SPHN|nr:MULTISPECIES: hypothetical protein [Sphingomonas]MDX3883448.1 hypothetical protein [Sphingomonas sp.]OHT20736.1 hypothetical protein BHE75_02737 [Sphingomonas haloaromaticamans]
MIDTAIIPRRPDAAGQRETRRREDAAPRHAAPAPAALTAEEFWARIDAAPR